MNTPEPLTLTTATIRRIKALAAAAQSSRDGKRELYIAIAGLSHLEQAELFTLYNLGRAGVRSFNVALAGANNQNPAHIAGMLAEKSNLAELAQSGTETI